MGAFLEVHFKNMAAVCSLCQKMVFEKSEQQIGFATAAKSGDYLGEAIVLFAYQAGQIGISFDFHGNFPKVLV